MDNYSVMVFDVTMVTFLMTLLMNEFYKYCLPYVLSVHSNVNNWNKAWYILHPNIPVLKYCHK